MAEKSWEIFVRWKNVLRVWMFVPKTVSSPWWYKFHSYFQDCLPLFFKVKANSHFSDLLSGIGLTQEFVLFWTSVFCYIICQIWCEKKGFDIIIFLFSRSLRVWKMRIEWQFCTRDEVEGVNLSRDSQFFKRDDSVKMEIYSGKPWVQPICQIYIT